MEAYLSRRCFMVNLKYDWLMMMSLGGALVSLYNVTSRYICLSPVLEPQILVRFRNFGL